MSSVWSQLEPHLAGVSKPARYIGLELGAQRPSAPAGAVSWLLTYPDTYEIGLPNQGLQIPVSYTHLTLPTILRV